MSTTAFSPLGSNMKLNCCSLLLIALCGAAGAETFAAQDRSSRRRFERHRVGLATLIASDLKALTLSARSPWAAKIIATRVAARLASLRVGQVLFPVILLLAFGKWKCFATLHTRDFNIWHDCFLHESAEWLMPSLFLGAPALAFLPLHL
jgi:hypothetical protein